MQKYGLVGKHLSYSYSKTIHEFLINRHDIKATYELIEVENVSRSLLENYDGLNVTIPYKETVIPFLNRLQTELTVVNTVCNKDGELLGYNTDIIGFVSLIKRLGFDSNKVTFVVLGSGATSKMIQTYFGERVVAIISRDGSSGYSYSDLWNIQADLLINATPIGMANYVSPVAVETLPQFQGIIDLNYNPMNSKLSHDALSQNVPFIGGLYMLIMQAIAAFEIWHNIVVADTIIEEIYELLCVQFFDKIALIGMPLSGKTTFIQKHEGVDLDAEIEQRVGVKIPQLLAEGTFREYETATIAEIVKQQPKLLALGGGAVLKSENIILLRDYLIVFLDVPLETLIERRQNNYRPLLVTDTDLEKIYYERYPLYQKRSNITCTSEQLERLVKNK